MIGKLRTRVGIYKAQTAPDGFGGSVTTWPFWALAWAEIRMLAPKQAYDNGRAEITAHYRIIIRYREGFPERARVIWGDRTLRVITFSDPDMRRERLHLVCEEEQQ